MRKGAKALRGRARRRWGEWERDFGAGLHVFPLTCLCFHSQVLCFRESSTSWEHFAGEAADWQITFGGCRFGTRNRVIKHGFWGHEVALKRGFG
jgi:hypothetical protein